MSEPKLRWCLFSAEELCALENALVLSDCSGPVSKETKDLLKEIEAYQKYNP